MAKKKKYQNGGKVNKPDYTGMGIGFMNNPEKYKAAFYEDFPKYIGGTVQTPGFKINPNAFYRGIGKEGFEDLVLNRIVRSKKLNAYPEPYFSKGKLGEAYSKGYALELVDEPMKGVGAFKDGDLIQTPVNVIKAGNKNLKVYKQLDDLSWENIPEYGFGGIIHNEMKKKKYPEGGKLPRYSIQTTSRNVKHPLTDLNLIDEMIARGYHTDRNALSKMSPEQRFSLIPQGTDLSWEKVKKGTANQGKYKIYQTIPHKTSTDVYSDGKLIMPNVSEQYLNTLGVRNKYNKGGQLGLDINQLYEQYGLGGWLKENAGGLLQTVGGGLATAVGTGLIGTGIGAPIGAALTSAGVGMLSSGIGSIAGNAAADEPEVIDYSKEIRMPRTVGKENMTPNVMSFAKGGSLKGISKKKAQEMIDNPPHGRKLTAKQKKTFNAIAHGWKPSYADGGKLMQLEGPDHSQGGIQFLPDAELEGGETVYNDVVNSDRIKITRQVASRYGLPKSAVGKTVADYTKEVDKRYEGREGDSIAMTGKELELNNISKMSKDLAPKNNTAGMRYGYGGLDLNDEDPTLYPGIFKFGRDVFRPGVKRIASNIADFTGYMFRSIGDQYPNRPWQTYAGTVNYIPLKNNLANYIQDNPPITGPEDPNNKLWGNFSSVPEGGDYLPRLKYDETVSFNPNMDMSSLKYTAPAIRDVFNINKVPNITVGDVTPNTLQPYKGQTEFPVFDSRLPRSISIDWNKAGDIGMDVLGAVPIGVSAFMAAKTAKEGPDTVKLPRVHADKYNPQLIDPRYQLDQVSDTFATANEGMSQVSKKDYMRRRIQSATEEGKARSGVLGQNAAMNTQLINQARMLELQSKERADQINLGATMQEEQINAANKGAWQTARDYQLSNLGTMAGEFARDIRMEKANKEYNDRVFEVLPNLFPGQTISKDNLAWQNTAEGALIPSPVSPYNNNTASGASNYEGWKDPRMRSPYSNPQLQIGLNPYNTFVDRSMGLRNRIGNYNLPQVYLDRPYTGRHE